VVGAASYIFKAPLRLWNTYVLGLEVPELELSNDQANRFAALRVTSWDDLKLDDSFNWSESPGIDTQRWGERDCNEASKDPLFHIQQRRNIAGTALCYGSWLKGHDPLNPLRNLPLWQVRYAKRYMWSSEKILEIRKKVEAFFKTEHGEMIAMFLSYIILGAVSALLLTWVFPWGDSIKTDSEGESIIEKPIWIDPKLTAALARKTLAGEEATYADFVGDTELDELDEKEHESSGRRTKKGRKKIAKFLENIKDVEHNPKYKELLFQIDEILKPI
jgi:hypothetical protein